MLLAQLLSVSVLTIVAAVGCMVLGLRQVITRRPFIVVARTTFWLSVLGFSPSIVNALLVFSMLSASDGSLFVLALLLLYAPVLYFLWRQTAGYLLLGVNDETFRHLLQHALHREHLPFEESLARLRIPSLDLDIQATVQEWPGIATFSVKQPRHRAIQQAIAAHIRRDLAEHPRPAVGAVGPLLLVTGGMLALLMLAFTGYMLLAHPNVYGLA